MIVKIYTDDYSSRTMQSEQLEVGETFTGNIGSFTGTFLVSFDKIILLDSPKHTWDRYKCSLTVYNYVKVDLEIKVCIKS